MMTERNIHDEDLTIVNDEEPVIQDEDADAVPPGETDPELRSDPEDYPEAAEDNPDQWQNDPLIDTSDEDTFGDATPDTAAPADAVPGEGELGEAGRESDQSLRAETEEERYREGDEQIPPEEPTLGEATDDVDFGDIADDGSADGSDDPANLGGHPLSAYGRGDPER